jgi:hypothetical protein
VGVYAVVAAVLLFFAFTRTEVGRNQLRLQIEEAFDARFAGRLEIGTLTGTLLNDLQATAVTLRDGDGAVVARIDSVATTPTWGALFTGELSVGSLLLVRPQLTLHRRADGAWNLAEALRRRRPDSTASPALDVSVSEIAVRNGRVTTTRSGPPPASVASGWLFDYTRSRMEGLDAEASVEWGTDTRRVVLTALQFRLPGPDLRLQSGRVDLARRAEQWTLQPVSLRLGDTEVRARGTVAPSPRPGEAAVLDLELAESRLDHDELRRLLPRLPLRNELTVEGRVGGTLDRFVVNELTLRHRQSRLTVEGTAFGLPDSLNVDAQVLRSQVRPSDLRSVWPDVPLGPLRPIGPVQLQASVRGTAQWTDAAPAAFDLTGTLSAEGAPGAVRGSLAVRRSPPGALRYDGRATLDSLNLAPLTDTDRLDSDLSGTVTVDGAGTRLATLDGTLDARLSALRVGSRRLRDATVRLQASRNRIEGTVSAEQPQGGRLSAEAAYDARAAAPRYRLSATAAGLNLASLSAPLPSSALNATLAADGQGASLRALTGELRVAVDSSQLRRDGQSLALPPHEATLRLAAPSASGPRLELDGTIASATVRGTPLHTALGPTARVWYDALRSAARSALDDARRSPPPTRPDSTSGREAERVTFAPERPLELEAELAIHRMDLLRRWWPRAPEQGDRLRAATHLVLGPDSLRAYGSMSADRLQIGPRRVDSVAAAYQVSGPRGPNLMQRLRASASAYADTLQLGARSVVRPSARVTLDEGQGDAAARIERLGRTGPLRFTSALRLDDGLHFDLREFFVGAGDNAWSARRPGTVSVLADAVVVDSLSLGSPRPNVPTPQRVLVRGTLSSHPRDTLHVDLSDVLLYPIGELAGLGRPLGGRATGDIAVTGGWVQPQVRSAVTVHRLTFDRRVLGDLQLRSRLLPDAPDLLVDAALTPGPSALDSLDGPPLVPDGPRVIEENRLQVQGRVRLPGLAEASPEAPATDPLDLSVTVERADLFFFKYIFEETLATVRGYTAGTIHVGGRFRDPIFDADLEIREGRFSLPQFGLAYSARGPVTVDRRGIHLQDFRVTDEEGTASVNGSVLFNEYSFFSFDLSASLDELSIVDVADGQDLAFYGDIRASGPVSLTGPLQSATLRSEAARTTPDSELFIPVSEADVDQETGFIVFADSTGQIPDLRDLTRRDNILSDRPAGEPTFLEGLEIDINVLAPEESTVHLVFDPVVGDVVTAVGTGRVQLQRQEGEFFVYGNYNVSGGTYLFTAGEVFVRRFNINEGTITWDGPPTNAQLDLKADYRTRASPAGLPGYEDNAGRIPVRVKLDIGGRVETPRVDLGLARVRDERNTLVGSQTLDAILNREDRTTEYATSVLLTNTFLLTTESFTQGQTTGADGSSSGSLTTAGNQLAFNSVSQLVASQLNRYLGAALPNVDLNLGVQGENPNDLDLIYGVALRLLNERLVIRGEGVYTGDDPGSQQAQGPQGEFVVEVRLSRRVSVEAFYRRSGDELTQGQTLTSSTGAGLSYQTEFPTWRRLFERVFGWLLPDDDRAPPPPPGSPPADTTDAPTPVARSEDSLQTAPAPMAPRP